MPVESRAEKLWLAVFARDVVRVRKELESKSKHKIRRICEFEVNKIVFSRHENIRDSLSCLHFAAKKGMSAIITAMFELSDEISPDVRTSILGWTPLHYATFGGHIHVIKFLINKGADLNVASNLHRRPIHLAIYKGFRKLAAYLIHRNCDVNVQDQSGLSPLHLCVDAKTMLVTGWTEQERFEMVEFLLIKGAAADARDQNGDCPLHYAVKHHAGEATVRLLASSIRLEDGVNLRNKQGESALHFATQEKQLSLLTELGLDINAVDCGGRSILHNNVGNHELLPVLFKYGAIGDIRDSEDRTALHYAAAETNPDLRVLELLANDSADVNVADNSGNTPLHLLCRGHYKHVRTPDSRGKLVFKYVRSDYDPAVEVLLGKNADVNIQNKKGETALHLCLHQRQLKRADFLLTRGADPSIRDNLGRDAQCLDRQWHARHFRNRLARKISLRVSDRHRLHVNGVPPPGSQMAPPKSPHRRRRNSRRSPTFIRNGTRMKSMVKRGSVGSDHCFRPQTPLPKWVTGHKDSDDRSLEMYQLLPNWIVVAEPSPGTTQSRAGSRERNAKPHAKVTPKTKIASRKTGATQQPRKPSLKKQLTHLQKDVQDVRTFLEEFAKEGDANKSKTSRLKKQTKAKKGAVAIEQELVVLKNEIRDVENMLQGVTNEA